MARVDARTVSAALALAVLATVVAAAAHAQRAAPPRRRSVALAVSVTDTANAAVQGAEVLIPALSLRRRTDAAGRLVLDSLPAGDYVVVARLLGFLPDSQRTRLTAGDTTAIGFQLRTAAYVLDTALVESAALRDKMVDFERRRASGRGTFITRDDIDRRNPIALADILRTVRGLTVRNAGGRTEIRFVRANARTDGPDCPPEMWVDGARTFGATVDEFNPGEVEGIELYRGLGQIPAQYLSRTSACGLVIIWTRSPSRMPR
jgi:carboxypeptidase family protein/TonB-dependent receptor-like protein